VPRVLVSCSFGSFPLFEPEHTPFCLARQTGKFSVRLVYYFDQGKLTGVLASGRPDEERKPMQALVKARPAYEDVAANLAYEDVDLDALTE
jgi:hypothetical protein